MFRRLGGTAVRVNWGEATTAFQMIKIGEANMTVDSQIGFNASLLSYYPPFPMKKFSAEVDGWQDNHGVNLTGKADTKVGVSLKQVWDKLPDEGLTLDVGAEFGKNTAGNALLLVERFVPIEEKSSYTLVLAQDAAGQLRLVTVEDAGPAVQIHAVNAGSAPLNLAINGAAAWNGLAANTVGAARSFALSHGTLTAQGDGGLAATLPLTTAHDLTLAAYQQGSQPALALFTSMNTFAGAEKVALRVAHLADGAPALDVTVNDFLLADDLTLGHAGPYALRTYRAFYIVVVKDGAGTVLKTFDNVVIPEGAAATLYVTGQGSDLALLVGVDTPAMRRTIATYHIQAAHVQVGAWQVLLRNALTGQDYELEVRGKQIEPVLSDPQLSYDSSHATIRWAYVGKEQNSVVDIRLTEITGPLVDTVVAQYPQTVEVLNGQGISETVTVTVTELAVPQRTITSPSTATLRSCCVSARVWPHPAGAICCRSRRPAEDRHTRSNCHYMSPLRWEGVTHCWPRPCAMVRISD